jgi:hypothetical protein
VCEHELLMVVACLYRGLRDLHWHVDDFVRTEIRPCEEFDHVGPVRLILPYSVNRSSGGTRIRKLRSHFLRQIIKIDRNALRRKKAKACCEDVWTGDLSVLNSPTQPALDTPLMRKQASVRPN